MTQQYLDHSKKILTSDYNSFKYGSKGSGLISLFGHQNEYDLRNGFPLLTTKKMATRAITHELIWFMNGDTNIKYLEDNKTPIWRGNAFEYNLPAMQKQGIFPKNIEKYSKEWDGAMKEYGEKIRKDSGFAEKFGDAGPIYGKQWRNWKYFDEDKNEFQDIDQLGNVIEKMKKKPVGKKHLVSAWNPGDVPKMSLPPCHVLYQMTSDGEGHLDLQLYQRSCDQFLGVPFNIASYAMLTKVIAQELDLEPRRFIHTFGDAHFYTGVGERTEWYKENFPEIKNKIKNSVEKDNKSGDKSSYLEVKDWIDKNAPADGNMEKYDHVTAVLEQLSRKPKKLPNMKISKKPFNKLTIDDFVLEGYDNPYPKIKRAMAV